MRTSFIALGAALAVAAPAQAETADQSTGWTPSEIVVTARNDDGYKVTVDRRAKLTPFEG